MRIMLILGVALVLVACKYNEANGKISHEDTQLNVECTKDSDCGTGGCSGQVCATLDEAAHIITTCEYREEYQCLKLTNCGCNEGKCGWLANTAYAECADRFYLE